MGSIAAGARPFLNDAGKFMMDTDALRNHAMPKSYPSPTRTPQIVSAMLCQAVDESKSKEK